VTALDTDADTTAADPASRERWATAHQRVLERLFAICGEAGATGTPPDAALALTSLAGQLAWHAELLGELVASSAGADEPPRPALGADGALDQLATLAAGGETAAVCVVVARVVVPRLLTAVVGARRAVDARVDGPRHRALTLVARDLRDALGALEPAAERALAVPGALDELARRCVEVERALVAGGASSGVVGATG
jgi:hypothetical protein